MKIRLIVWLGSWQKRRGYQWNYLFSNERKAITTIEYNRIDQFSYNIDGRKREKDRDIS
jgi:hypothetical protein